MIYVSIILSGIIITILCECLFQSKEEVKRLQDITETIVISKDGNKYCALMGPDLQAGTGGFGDTPTLAFINLGQNLEREITNDINSMINKGKLISSEDKYE